MVYMICPNFEADFLDNGEGRAMRVWKYNISSMIDHSKASIFVLFADPARKFFGGGCVIALHGGANGHRECN